MSGLIHFLDLHQRLRIKKVLTHWRQRDEKEPDGSEIQQQKQNVSQMEEHDSLGGRPKPQIEENIKNRNNISCKSPTRTEFFKKKRRGKDHKRNISSTSSHLLRTISIHHLKCDDYVQLDDNRDASTVEQNSQEKNSSESSEHTITLHQVSEGLITGRQCRACGAVSSGHHVDHNQLDDLGNYLLKKQLLLSDELKELKEAMSKQEDKIAKQSGGDSIFPPNDFVHMMELLNANKELLLKILQAPNLVQTSNVEAQLAPRAGTVLDESGPFPVPELSERKNDILQIKTNIMQNKSSASLEVKNQAEFSSSILSISQHAPSKEGACEADNLKKGPGTLDSISCTTPEVSSGFLDAKKHRNSGAALNHFQSIKRRIKDVIKDGGKEQHRISMDRIQHRIPYGCKVSADASDAPVPWKRCTSEKFMRNTSMFSQRNESANKTIRRSHSLSESLDKYSSLAESISRIEPKKFPDRVRQTEEDGDLQRKRLPRTLERIFSLPELKSCALHLENPSGEHSTLLPEEILTMDFLDDSQTIGTHGSDKLRPKAASAKQAENSFSTLYNRDAEVQADDSYFQEGTDLRCRNVCLEKQDSLTISESQFGVDASDCMENNEIYFDTQALSLLTGLDTLHIRVDQKNKAEFNYVRDILQKSRFITEEVLEELDLPCQSVDSLPLADVESSPCEQHIARDGSEPNTPLDEELLFDLVNEVLLEIYDISYKHCPWFTNSGFRTRPMPTGYHLVQEVWDIICWHLNSETQPAEAFESIVARQYERNDGWMNLQSDTEILGLELEDLILDDLLDEAIHQFSCASSH